MGPGSKTRSFYKPELDLLRFFAFLLVFCYHFLPGELLRGRAAAVFHTGCEQGVQIFFLLSAFLITSLLLQEQERTGTVQVKAFYVRRILRIWPLYFLLILAAAVLTALRLSQGFPLRALASFSLLGGNWYVVHHGWVTSPVSPLWTISIEEQFYLLWPLTLWCFPKRGLVVLSTLFVAGAYAALLWLGGLHAPEYAVRANSFVQFQFFAFGAALALCLHGRAFRPGIAGRFALFATGAAATALAVSRFHLFAESGATPAELVWGYLLLAVSAGCTFLGFLNAGLPRWAGPLVYCGRISYGLYAFHFIAFAWSANLRRWLLPADAGQMLAGAVHIAMTAVLCLALAMLSYYCLEKPFLRLKQRFTLVKSRDDLHTGSRAYKVPRQVQPTQA